MSWRLTRLPFTFSTPDRPAQPGGLAVPQPVCPRYDSLPLEQSGILSQVQKMGQTMHLDKLQETSLTLPATVPFYREGESHLKAIYAMPVGDGAGVLYVDTKYGWGFSDKQQKWIREIAAVLHQLLKRQDCLAQQQGFAGILQFWYKVDDILLKELSVIDSCRRFVSECSQLLEIEYGFAALREVGQPHYHVLAGTPNIPQSLLEQQFLIKQGLAGWVFEQAKGLHIARMNPHTPEHFLFTPAEGLPHHGTLWGLPVPISLGHTLALFFLARAPQELNADCQHAISCAAHAFALHLDRVSLQEECDHLQTYDLTTGILNSATFASRADALLATSMQTSSPFALALMQFEPWHHTAHDRFPQTDRGLSTGAGLEPAGDGALRSLSGAHFGKPLWLSSFRRCRFKRPIPSSPI